MMPRDCPHHRGPTVRIELIRWCGARCLNSPHSSLMSQDMVSPPSSNVAHVSALARYIVDAVVLERRSPTGLARDHGITRRWIHKLVKRFKEGGYSALEALSRRPHSCSHQISSDVQAKVLRLRLELAAAGHDAGHETIAGPGI